VIARVRRGLAESAAAVRSVFANTDLARVQWAWAGSVFGQWFYVVALGVYAYEADGAGGVALVAFVRFGLGALFAPIASLLGDRLPRRTVMVGADLVRAAALVGAAAVVALDGWPPLVYAMACIVTVTSSAYHPAEAALLPDLARTPEELTAANVVAGTSANLSGLAAPALGGLLFAATGAAVVFLVTAATFLASAAVLARLGVAGAVPPTGGDRDGVLRSALAGFALVARDVRLRAIIGVYAAGAAAWGLLSVAIVVVALDDLSLGEEGPGLLLGVASVGGLVGAVLAGALTATRRLAWWLGIGSLVWGIPLVAAGLRLETWVVVAALVVLGIGEALIEVTTMTLLQRAVPSAVRARVFGVLESLTVGAIALGGAVAAPLLSATGAGAALMVAGLLTPAAAVIAWRSLAAIDRRADVPAEELALLSGVEMFALLPPPVLESLAGRLGVVPAVAGQIVLREGEGGDLLYLVEEGELEVSRNGTMVETLRPGDVFGEIALLRDVPRTATVTARSAGRLRTLDRDGFLAAVTGHDASRRAADAVVESRLAPHAGGVV
jgi:MFS family permease